MLKQFILGLSCLLALAGCAAEMSDAEAVSDGTVADQESSEVRAADHAPIAFRVIEGVDLASNLGQTETRRVFRTATAFRSYFGVSAPGVNFSREWVVFYSAGVERTGGYAASVAEIRTSSSGATLKVTTRLDSPGADCIVTESLTKPHVIVAFAIPESNPSYARYYRDDASHSCTDPCSLARCRAGTLCDSSSGAARCVAFPTCESTGMRCITGSHCVDRAIMCVRAPCPPTAPACTELCEGVNCGAGSHCVPRGNAVSCVANDPCATARCAAGTYCDGSTGTATCLAYSTCLNVRCTATTHCEDLPIMCVRAPCPPTAPQCI